MANVWFLGDLHAGHKNIANFRKDFASEEDHYSFMKEEYHKVVTKRDLVFFMGDTAFTKERLEDISKWTGEKKVAILGNHCHTKGTELLTKTGWVPVEEVTLEHEVATVDITTGNTVFANPSRLVVNKDSNLVRISSPWVEDVVSEGHRVLVNGKLVPAICLVGKKLQNSGFTLSAFAKNTGVGLPLGYMKLLTWVIMDGTIVRVSEKKTRVQFKLSKESKIIKLEKLLASLNIPYTKRLCKKYGINNLQPYYIRIYGEHSLKIHEHLDGVKQIPNSWANMSREEVEAVVESILDTDGNKQYNKIYWTTTSKNDVEVMQRACVLSGYAFRFRTSDTRSGFSNAKLQYQCTLQKSQRVRSSKQVKVEKLDGKGDTFGVTMLHGTTIARRNGKVWVTGNCLEKECSIMDYVKAFDDVQGFMKYKEFWLSHCPIHPAELRGKTNLHGHVHSATIDDVRYFNTSLENINYKPISLYMIREKIKELTNKL